MTSINVPSEATIRKALHEFQISVDAHQVVQIQEYIKLLLKWNDKVNLTAIRDPLDILYRHFCDSMFAATVVKMDKCRIADIGSGGGFPGLPLKILWPESTVVLVESNVKKATFLAEVVRTLELKNTQVLVSRYEELGEEIAPIDYICARALGDFVPFLSWAASQKVDVMHILLWVGEREVAEVQQQKGWEWHIPIPVPQSLRRIILLGTKAAAANQK